MHTVFILHVSFFMFFCCALHSQASMVIVIVCADSDMSKWQGSMLHFICHACNKANLMNCDLCSSCPDMRGHTTIGNTKNYETFTHIHLSCI